MHTSRQGILLRGVRRLVSVQRWWHCSCNVMLNSMSLPMIAVCQHGSSMFGATVHRQAGFQRKQVVARKMSKFSENPRTPANVREHSPMNTRECPRTPANARERPRMPANVRECPRTSANTREHSANTREHPRTPANTFSDNSGAGVRLAALDLVTIGFGHDRPVCG